jgi:ABC-type uncharacterized transport system substrate-binding protein
MWPHAVHAQQAAMPVVGWLEAYTPEVSANYLAAFCKGLREMGYVEARNVAIESRLTMSQNDRVPELVAEFVRRRVAVIVAAAGNPAVEAKAATSTIPIVFTTAADPVAMGLVPSFNRPGGNITGFSTDKISTDRPSAALKAPLERGNSCDRIRVGCQSGRHESDAARLLRAHFKRPSRRCASDPRDEFPPSHWITSLAG